MNVQRKTQFDKVLRELMKEQNLSILGLAKRVDIPRTTINNWLNQKRSPGVEYLNRLSAFFGVSIDYLLGLEDL